MKKTLNILFITILILLPFVFIGFLAYRNSQDKEKSSEPLTLDTSQAALTPKRDLNNLKIEKVTPQKQIETTGTAPNPNANIYTLKSLDNDIVEIGTERHSPPKPYLKMTKWDSEVSLKVSIPFNTGDNPEERDGKLVYKGDKKSVEFYSRKPEEVTEKDSKGNEHIFTINEDGGVEFDTILEEKPTTNSISFPIETQGLDFFYQPPLNEGNKDPTLTCTQTTCTDEKGNVVTFRSEQVVGSYAVYNKDEKSGDYTQLGGKNYKTGKAFHIYRPKVTDAAGNETWGELKVDEKMGTLTITVDREWLKIAVYPVTIDPTFGYAVTGASSYTIASYNERMVGSLFTGEAGTVKSITAFVACYTSNNQRAAIYLHSDLTLLVSSTSRAGDGSSLNWRTFTLATPVNSATDYLLTYAVDDTGGWTNNTRYDSGSTDQGHRVNLANQAAYDTLPSPVTITTHNTDKYSIYATYTSSYTASGSSNTPGTIVDDSAVGTLTWSNPIGAIVSDDSYTTTSLSSIATSHYLKATDFGFAVPTGATINGILVEADIKFEEGYTAYENEMKIVKADGSIGSENKANKTAGRSSGTEATFSYGGASDLWSEDWTTADINDSDFGVVFSYDRTSGCLTENSFVTTPKGPLGIKNLEVGDTILSYDESTKQIEEDTVSHTIRYPQIKRDVYYIYTGWLNKRIEATSDHKFYTQRGLVEAKDLTNRDILIDQNLKNRRITNVKKITRTEYVYDISVEKNHNYFVNGILVHNLPWAAAYIDQIRIAVYYTEGGGGAAEGPKMNFNNLKMTKVKVY
jgi:hypothetical protein